MRSPILLIENLPEDCPNSVADLARIFRAETWVVVSADNATVRLQSRHESLRLPDRVRSPLGPLQFYRILASHLPRGSTIVRVRNPVYPLHQGLWDEIASGFPEGRFDYVLSTGVECGLAGYFVERLNSAALESIGSGAAAIMPEGYFNGTACPRSGRHWFSLELRRFYLEEHFETLFASPRSVAVNAVPGCNYRCVKCQYHSPRAVSKRKYGPPMSVDTFGEILQRCRAYRLLMSVAPTISGEPLLHPEIDRLVRMTKDAGYACGFATNALLLTDRMGKRLLDAGADSLAFSVDSIDPDTYARLQGGSLEKVERNILAFQEATIRERGSFFGTMVCVVSRENEHEVEEYRKRWLDRGFAVVFSAEHDIGANNEPFFAHKRWAPSHRMPCFSLWHGLYLSEAGNVFTCGATARGEGLKDNFLAASPETLWRSRSLRLLRRQQLLGETPGYCKGFSCWTGMMGTWVHEGGRLTYHTQGTWLEQPFSTAAPEPAGKAGWLHRTVAKLRKLGRRES